MASSKKTFVINSLGEREGFSEKKVLNSLKRSGASNEVANKVLSQVKERLVSDMKTSEIFKMIKSFLRKEKFQVALKFNLKESIKILGPAGFIFERYVTNIFQEYGYKVKTDQIIYGRCIDYEMDVLAQKENTMYLGECKYRNSPGEKVDVNVCLKEFALLSDIRKGKFFSSDSSIKSIQSLIITNTKFTDQAIKYAECEGLYLLGWRYPLEGGLEKLIEDKKLYPITILPSFKKYLMGYFVEKNMMLVKNLLEIKDVAKFAEIAKIPARQIESLCQEARILLED